MGDSTKHHAILRKSARPIATALLLCAFASPPAIFNRMKDRTETTANAVSPSFLLAADTFGNKEESRLSNLGGSFLKLVKNPSTQSMGNFESEFRDVRDEERLAGLKSSFYSELNYYGMEGLATMLGKYDEWRIGTFRLMLEEFNKDEPDLNKLRRKYAFSEEHAQAMGKAAEEVKMIRIFDLLPDPEERTSLISAIKKELGISLKPDFLSLLCRSKSIEEAAEEWGLDKSKAEAVVGYLISNGILNEARFDERFGRDILTNIAAGAAALGLLASLVLLAYKFRRRISNVAEHALSGLRSLGQHFPETGGWMRKRKEQKVMEEEMERMRVLRYKLASLSEEHSTRDIKVERLEIEHKIVNIFFRDGSIDWLLESYEKFYRYYSQSYARAKTFNKLESLKSEFSRTIYRPYRLPYIVSDDIWGEDKLRKIMNLVDWFHSHHLALEEQYRAAQRRIAGPELAALADVYDAKLRPYLDKFDAAKDLKELGTLNDEEDAIENEMKKADKRWRGKLSYLLGPLTRSLLLRYDVEVGRLGGIRMYPHFG